MFFPGQEYIVCYCCCQSGHSRYYGCFCKQTQLYAEKAAKAKVGPDATLKQKFEAEEKKPEPDIALEWQDMKITFRIVSDFDLDQEQKNRYELFPNFDASSPSAPRLFHSGSTTAPK